MEKINEKEVPVATPTTNTTTETDKAAKAKELLLARAKQFDVIDAKGNINETLLNKREAIAKRFEKYAALKANQIRENMQLRNEMASVLAEALGELPSAKYLIQKSEGAVSNSIYDEVIDKIFSAQEEVPVGTGAEYCLINGMAVNALDTSKFIPSSRNDIDNYMYWDKIDIPTEIKQTELTIATWMYFQYFLSGKVDEVANIVRAEVTRSIKLKAQYDLLQIPKQIFQTVYAKAGDGTTNHLAGSKTYIVDAVKEWLDFIFPMLSHNKKFAYGTFNGYNNAVEADLIHITNYETYNNIIKVATTFLAKEQFETFSKVNKFVVLPTSIFNPTSDVADIEQLNILSDTSGQRVAGAILTLDKRGLKRLYNLESTYSQFFPKNLTDVLWANYRYAQGCLKWAQVAVYDNKALEQDFYIPTTTTTTTRK